MAINLKPASALQSKFATRASAASPDYKDGVMNPKRSQSEAAIAAADAYASGIQQAIGDQRFQKGLRKAGDAKWQAKASSVGANRYPSGVQAAAPDWAQGVQPYFDAISKVSLPPRLPKGDPANINRVAAVATALRQVKLQIG